MATMVSDAIVERLQHWGVERIFGYAGDGINGLLGALNRAGNNPEFIQARHEEMAAFEAVGYAKYGNRVGICMATSGPGAVHLLNGLYDAKLDRVPVVAIVGQQPRKVLGSHAQQEIDLQTLFSDVSEYVQTAMTAEQFPGLIDRAIRIALSERMPTCIIVPADLQEEEYTPPPHALKGFPSSAGYRPAHTVPNTEDLQRAAEVINSGERVAILIGSGARDARDEVVQLAELTGAGVAKALLGKDVLDDNLPYVTGALGLLGTKPSWDLMMNCDTFLMIGSNFPYPEFLPKFDQARGVQIEIDPKQIGVRFPMEVNLVGDATITLQALLPLLQRKTDRSWREEIESCVRDWWQVVEARAMQDADPINPQRAFWELSSRLPDNAMISADSGSGTNWYARDVKLREGMRASLSGILATMGPAVPYAIGAKFAHPERPAIALAGDGAMQMNGINELITISKYWQTWADPRLVVMVLHNDDLNQVTWEMRSMAGDAKYEASQDIPDFPYAQYAQMLGLNGIRVDDPDQLGKAWEQALTADRPTVLEVIANADVPPIPPHIDFSQMKSFTNAVLHGDPDSLGMIKQGIKGKLAEYTK
ncbi:thiamine pyrophosphate-requiring protein [Blastococcus capsensis]|uniref:thiamine pyrophosphate-requiring protein n=1 Tax=Blastococcus capsensis TaxID=1564163 RepID=UPI0025401C2C|nr:thiamine pyrophosphate-requiring protein [Blastococcus capsensis]MDK3258726.1 thiamine pyrophosphate-requiring protein [Blastococcus capsensis]